ncbi:hypothetical protein BGZ80_006889 [Entomortierella chlamydospora]|uniref:N-acetyltransferase domain-containing protein n=1 Tax=Entomortierella chlamydospora TaxID=101097 RepID=A0A9P6T1N6_9FUNG|nr:hypothetical protein BGZ80_006889 [Entomortierella chlamydospora]
MPSSNSTASATPSLLQPISNEDACSTYFAELIDEMPFAVSQFGLVLTTALEGKQARADSGPTQLHFRSKVIPVSGSADEEPVDFTNFDVTFNPSLFTTFSARCESLLMRAAATATIVDTDINLYELSADELANRATSENFVEALKKLGDPWIQGHYQNFLAFIPNMIEHWSAERARQGLEAKKVGCFCINDIWRLPLASLASKPLTIWTRAVKFVISEEDLLKTEPEIRARCQQLEEEQGLVLGPMTENDVKLMLECNKVSYNEEYGRWIVKRSRCFRNKQGDMVAWAGTHGDFSIAALHVLPEYRKAGLGRLILNSLALFHMRLAREVLASNGNKGEDDISTSSLFAHADCVEGNLPTMAFMERCGWRRVGIYNWFEMSCNGNSVEDN